MKPWARDVFTRHPAPAPSMLAELSRLRAALPDYDVILIRHAPGYRFEAIRRPGAAGHGPWCVISANPADLWRELTPRTHYGANSGRAAEPSAHTCPRPGSHGSSGREVSRTRRAWSSRGGRRHRRGLRKLTVGSVPLLA